MNCCPFALVFLCQRQLWKGCWVLERPQNPYTLHSERRCGVLQTLMRQGWERRGAMKRTRHVSQKETIIMWEQRRKASVFSERSRSLDFLNHMWEEFEGLMRTEISTKLYKILCSTQPVASTSVCLCPWKSHFPSGLLFSLVLKWGQASQETQRCHWWNILSKDSESRYSPWREHISLLKCAHFYIYKRLVKAQSATNWGG